jgi:hypothetical protein
MDIWIWKMQSEKIKMMGVKSHEKVEKHFSGKSVAWQVLEFY